MIKKMTITRDELRAGDWPLEAEAGQQYITVYREIPEFGNSAKLHAAEEELAKAKRTLSGVNEVAHRYFAQARRLRELGANRLADKAVINGERILAALRQEGLQDWPLPTEDDEPFPGEARAWNAWLHLALDTTLEDGTPLLRAVFEHNPELAARLRKALEKK